MPSTSPGSPQTLKCQWLLRHASSPTKSLRSPILHRLDPCPQTPATNGGHASWHSAGVRLRGESTRRPEKECACWVHHRLSQPPAALPAGSPKQLKDYTPDPQPPRGKDRRPEERALLTVLGSHVRQDAPRYMRGLKPLSTAARGTFRAAVRPPHVPAQSRQ